MMGRAGFVLVTEAEWKDLAARSIKLELAAAELQAQKLTIDALVRERGELRAELARHQAIDDERCKIVDELRAEIERLSTIRQLQTERIVRAEDEVEQLQNLLAECYPLVRPGTDLSRRLREAVGWSRA